ncbi:hypothetical protein [Natrinema sp. DC36]|uniref:hypothetical protein n=1 Tax=Natrinema sp. DC36 TaxID=2878680 RepID=UPI001CF051B7|nr:hypothetical protein [Natrinema sp. DC36]
MNEIETRVVMDLQIAAMVGCFAVETPRVHLEQDDIDGLCVGLNTPYEGVDTLKIEFDFVENSYTSIYKEFERCGIEEETVVLYGYKYLWYCRDIYYDIDLGSFAEGEKLAGTVNYEFTDVTFAEKR